MMLSYVCVCDNRQSGSKDIQAGRCVCVHRILIFQYSCTFLIRSLIAGPFAPGGKPNDLPLDSFTHTKMRMLWQIKLYKKMDNRKYCVLRCRTEIKP